ncbi:MAG: branched-chain-amino-acid transaminase [Candidatus Omnitrophica bacterium]|nr:branched-chain-amino-acid transaminase [Candidatus Omnitrophota bacterium]
MSLKVYIDGKLVEKDKAKISVFDHGLLYGDGVFEGIRSYKSLVFKLKEHIDRLYESAHTIMLDIPMSKAQMTKAVINTLKANKLKDAYIRVLITRGVGDLGLDPRKCKKASIIIITDNIVLYPKELYQKGLEIITVPTVRNLSSAVDPQIKSLNYLNNIMAKIEAINSGYQEAIMLNSMGFVAECTGDNIFMIKNKQLYTPPQSMGTLRGITRDAVIAVAKGAKIQTHENILTRHEIFNADELFLTGTAAEVIPVVKVDSRKIGNGKPGKITLQLLKEFNEITRKEGVKYKV